MAKKEPPVQELDPTEGGSYIRNKDGSLTKVVPVETEQATLVAETKED